MAKKKIGKAAISKAKEDPFAPIAKELALAYVRVNGVPTRRLRWLLNFSELELDKLSEGRLADLRWEVVVFGLNRRPDQMKNKFDMFFEFSMLTEPPFTWPVKPSDEKEYERVEGERQKAIQAERDKGAHPSLITEFQNTMRDAFNTLFSGEQWRIKRPSSEEALALTHIKGKHGRWASNPPAFTGHDILLMQAIDLIKAEKERLRVCQNPNCGKRFVAAKKGRAFFHSPQCSAYVRVNKARGKM
jgi:hypothetical protein